MTEAVLPVLVASLLAYPLFVAANRVPCPRVFWFRR